MKNHMHHKNRHAAALRTLLPFAILLLLLGLLAGCQTSAPIDEAALQTAVSAHNVTPLEPKPTLDPALVMLGQALFFDKELSGNRDISCATCHHPTQGSGDGLPVSIGTGGAGLGPARQIGYNRQFIPRNAPEVFNRGASEWRTMFWDGRVALYGDHFMSPADLQLPRGLSNVLAVQAMFPVTSAEEMRGQPGDVDVNGRLNEIAVHDDVAAIWERLMNRILAHPTYVQLFQAAYPDVPVAELGFEHAANAIAAFEIDAYTFTNSPWQRYLQGDLTALSDEAKAGALLFYGDAGCASCHSGSLLTDQRHYNLAVPQVGSGKGLEAPLDLGRFRESQDESDLYAFRTPSLHNVAASGPWMHNGAFSSLAAVIQHHLNPAASLRSYNPTVHLPAALHDNFQNDPALLDDMVQRLDPALTPQRLTANEVAALVAFLEALTDPQVYSLDHLVPAHVPSGLPVAEQPLPDLH